VAIDTSDFKPGMAFYMDGEVHQILDFQHVKPGKGPAFVRTKLKKLKTGATFEKTFRSGEKFDDAFIERLDYQYLYRQGDELILMDLDSYEQVPVEETVFGDGAKFLKEEMQVSAMRVGNDVLGYEVPQFVELEVVETDPVFKGDTVTGGSGKPATLETGAIINVPFFVTVGEVVKVDTRTKEYLERVKK
jgi:elongation factor P